MLRISGKYFFVFPVEFIFFSEYLFLFTEQEHYIIYYILRIKNVDSKPVRTGVKTL